MTTAAHRPGAPSRRVFLRHASAAGAGVSLAAASPRPGPTAEANTIPIALVGCGGRGTGAALNALSTAGPTRLVAMADFFAARLEASLANLAARFPDRVRVPGDARFVGLGAYRKAIDAIAPGGVAILATPPAFRPSHVEYAVSKGCHVFMEKSFGVDAPGVRRILKAGKEAARRNLKVAGGLMSRHYRPLEDAVEKIRSGAIGDVITCWAYRMHGPVGFHPRTPDVTELGHQIRNYSCFTWLNGSFLLDWLIHNLDVCCWVKDAWPVSAQGQGGRQVRTEPDQLFDHYAVEYSFPDGTRLFAQGRHQQGTWGFFGDVIQGARGVAVLGEGIKQPRMYRGHRQEPDALVWQGGDKPFNHYQHEHDLLFDAIRADKPYNETERCARAAMVGILGRMAAETGQLVTWDEAMASETELAPGLDSLTENSPPPVQPDAQGRYPVARPGGVK